MPPLKRNGGAVVPANIDLSYIAPDLRPLAVPINSVRLDPNNLREHGEGSILAIQDSLSEFGQQKPIVVNRHTGIVIAGNGTVEAARGLGWQWVAANQVALTDAEAAEYGLMDNLTAEQSAWKAIAKAKVEAAAKTRGLVPGFTFEELITVRRLMDAVAPPPADSLPRVSLSDKFLVPPFSVLDARQGYWQDRKRAWLVLGIQSELGRGENLIERSLHDRITFILHQHYSVVCKFIDDGRAAGISDDQILVNAQQATGKMVRGDGRGKPLAATFGSGKPGDLAAGFKAKGAHPIPGGSTGKNSAYMFKTAEGYKPLKELQAGETSSLKGGLTHGTTIHPYDESSSQVQSGTSIFDPVLCELAYRWFCPSGGQVFDPFAGGSVRGIVAARLGRAYAGIDLRPEQAAANEAQAERILTDPALPRPLWLVGDAADALDMVRRGDLPKECDLVFSCPPYADLERYSDDPRDLSTMDYAAFLEAYEAIIADACSLLRVDRFACFVVGDVRGPNGSYRNFIGATIEAFRKAGLSLYNEMILVTAVGSLPIRVGRQFSGARKVGKTHQQVLCFLKGDAKRAVEACGSVDMDFAKVLENVQLEEGTDAAT